MRCNSPRLLLGTVRKHLLDGFCHPHHESLILFITIRLGPLATRTALPGIGRTLCPGLLQRRFFDQDSLAFVALTRLAKAQHQGGKLTVFPSPSGQGIITARQVNQMVEISAGEAKGSSSHYMYEIPTQQPSSALGTLFLPEGFEYNQVFHFGRLLIIQLWFHVWSPQA